MKINYIKAHFVTSTPNISLVNKYFRASHNIKIATFLDYGNLKVTLMGKEFQFVNVTGASQISVIENFMMPGIVMYLLRSEELAAYYIKSYFHRITSNS